MTFDVDAYDKNGNTITNLVQWDIDVHVYVDLGREPNDDEVFSINFFNCSSGVAYAVDTSYESGMIKAKIPNILLQESRPITGYISLSSDSDERGVLRIRINVRPMPRPSTYVFPNDKDYITTVSVLDDCILYAEAAKNSELNAKQCEESAANFEQKAIDESLKSEGFAKLSESWAVGNTGVRDGEDSDNSKYYSDQSKMHKEEIEEASNYSKSYTVGGTGTRDGEDEDNIKFYYDKIKYMSEYFDIATLEEVEAFLGVNVSGE